MYMRDESMEVEDGAGTFLRAILDSSDRLIDPLAMM
jgi:hypothetical protein